MNRAGVPLDLISVQQWLKDAGQLDKIGGIAYLSACQDKVPSAANLPYYFEILQEKHTARKLLGAATEMASSVYEPQVTVAEVVSAATKQILELSEVHSGQPEESVAQIMPAVVVDLEKYHRGGAQMRGLSTGLEYLDKLLCGIGGDDNNMIVWAGRPGTGKTSLALDVVLHVALDHPRYEETTSEVAKQAELDGEKISVTEEGKFYLVKRGLPVAIFSLEMTKKALTNRMVFQRAQADAQRWRTGYAVAADFPPITKAAAEVSHAPVWIDDTGRCTIDELKARARRLHRQHGIRLFVVDYIQLLSTGSRRFRDDRVQELAEISGELQKLGKELKCPFIILAQMNRDYEKEPNREPRLSDLKDCGAIEQDADVVGFLHTPKKAEDDPAYTQAMEKLFGDDWVKYPRRVDLLLAKSRNGPTGVCKLLFQKSSMHFFDWYRWLKSKDLMALADGERKEAGRARGSSRRRRILMSKLIDEDDRVAGDGVEARGSHRVERSGWRGAAKRGQASRGGKARASGGLPHSLATPGSPPCTSAGAVVFPWSMPPSKALPVLAASASLAAAPGCIPFAIPPARAEIAEGARLGIAPARSSASHVTPAAGVSDTAFAAGAHLATFLPRTPIDTGAGYLLSDLGLGERLVQGAYGEVGAFLPATDHLRLVGAVRGVAMPAQGGQNGGYALSLRLAGELHATINPFDWGNSVGGGAMGGAAGFGWFVESGPQVLPGGERATVISGGVWIELPATAGIACCVPPEAIAKVAGKALWK